MARVDLVEKDGAPENVRAIYEKMEQKSGMVLNLAKAMGHSPLVLESFMGIVGPIGGEGAAPPKLKEIVLLSVARLNGCAYCQGHHTKMASRAGLSQDQINALPDTDKDLFDETERMVINLAREITQDVAASDQTFQSVHNQLGDAQTVELVYLASLMNLLTRFADTLKVELED